jgi:hypothetical protein
VPTGHIRPPRAAPGDHTARRHRWGLVVDTATGPARSRTGLEHSVESLCDEAVVDQGAVQAQGVVVAAGLPLDPLHDGSAR